MSDKVKFASDFLVLIIVAFPPFLYLYRLVYDRVRRLWLRIIIYLLYWIGTMLFSNIVPASTVLILIYFSENDQLKLEEYNETERKSSGKIKGSFCLCEEKWKFTPALFIKYFIYGILIKYAVSYINLILIQIFSGILGKYGIVMKNQEVINQFLQSNIVQTIFYFIIIVFCAPIVEEFVFRFWIYDRILKKRTSSLLAAIFSSLLFMAVHFNIQGAVAFFLIGMINCYLYDNQGYFAAVTNHFTFNFISAVVLIVAKIYKIPI